MRNHTVSFHLSESESSVSGPTLRRLTCENLRGASSSRVHLVCNHMLKALIVRRAKENHDFHSLACESVVHDFVSKSLVAEVVQLAGDKVHSLTLERSGVTFVSVERGDLTEQTLDQMANGHARRDSVRVDNHVRYNSFDCERQVLLSVRNTDCSLLSMATGKLVSDLRNFYCAHLYFHEPLVVFICGQNDLVNDTFFRMSQWSGEVFVGLNLGLSCCHFIDIISKFDLSSWSCLSNNDVVATGLHARANNSIFV